MYEIKFERTVRTIRMFSFTLIRLFKNNYKPLKSIHATWQIFFHTPAQIIMNLLDLPEAILYLIISFYFSNLNDLNNLRLGNNGLNLMSKMIENMIYDESKMMLFQGYVGRFPEIKEFLDRPLYKELESFKYRAIMKANDNLNLDYMKKFLRMAVYDKTGHFEILKGVFREIITSKRFDLSSTAAVPTLSLREQNNIEIFNHLKHLLVCKFKQNLLENRNEFDELLEFVFDVPNTVRQSILDRCQEGFMKKYYFSNFFHPIIFKPFSKWRLIEILMFPLLLQKLFVNYQPGNMIVLGIIIKKLGNPCDSGLKRLFEAFLVNYKIKYFTIGVTVIISSFRIMLFFKIVANLIQGHLSINPNFNYIMLFQILKFAILNIYSFIHDYHAKRMIMEILGKKSN